MEENKQPQEQTTEKTAGENNPKQYARYMGTLNRIYGRKPNSRKRKLESGIDSLKKGAADQTGEAENGKMDKSFWFVLLGVVVVFGAYWVIKNVFF